MSESIIKIKYQSPDLQRIGEIPQGDWIDLRSAMTYNIKKGDFLLINLGVSMQLPEGYEAHMAPRSSTFKNYGLIQTNGVAVIDESYCGDDDIWRLPVYATCDTTVNRGDRICQFRIMKKQPHIVFEETESLSNTNRGGFGSTGKN